MPNLAGIFSYTDKCGGLGDRLGKMRDILTYWDWYQKYSRLEDNIGAVNVSTGVFKLSNQPVFNEKRDLWLMMEGEIYDTADLRKELSRKGHVVSGESCDECVLHLYEEVGYKFVERMNGQFVIVIYSIVERKLVIVNDRLGFRPLYYADTGKEFIFSSEIKAILATELIPREVDGVGLLSLLFLGYNICERTLLKDIKVLPAASIMEVDKQGYHIKKYWSMKFVESDETRHVDYYIEELGEVLIKAVDRRSTGRFGVALSGGLDSRMVAGALKPRGRSVYTYTFGDPRSLDARYAKRVAEAIGAENEFLTYSGNDLSDIAHQIVWHTEANVSVLSCKSLSFQNQLKTRIDVILSGSLGDHLLGFPITGKLIRARKEQLGDFLLQHHHDFKDIRSGGSIFGDDFAHICGGQFRDSFLSSISALNLGSNASSANIVQAWDIDNRQRRYILGAISIDRHLFEIRTPFADCDLIDLILRIPPELRYNYYIYKKMAGVTFPFLNEIPWEKTELKITLGKNIEKILRLGFKIVRRAERNLGRMGVDFAVLAPKVFLDFEKIFRTDAKTKGFLAGILLDSKTLQRPYFSRKGLETLMSEHFNGKANHAETIGKLITFELFLRRFVDVPINMR